MLILIEQVLKQYWYVSRCANNELAPCILKLKNNTEWKQTTVTEITENRFGNFRFWGENMLDRFGFFSFSSPDVILLLIFQYEGPAKSFVTGFGLLQCYVLSNIFLLQTFKVFPLY